MGTTRFALGFGAGTGVGVFEAMGCLARRSFWGREWVRVSEGRGSKATESSVDAPVRLVHASVKGTSAGSCSLAPSGFTTR